MSPSCNRCEELNREVAEVLVELVHLTTSQLEAFRTRDDSTFMKLDRELELTLGKKERCIGAQREHRQFHKAA